MNHLVERELSDERRRYLEKTLNPDIALRRTAYDDQGKPPCDEDTRVDILVDITTWVNDVSPHSQNFFWLTGDPGCGKSAITASLARYCKGAGIPWAQFFINRNNESTTNPRVYFPSIAHQFAEHSPTKNVEKAIYDILKANPCLLDGMTLDQARILFVQVVQVACDLDRGKPVVVVIDGLDETSRKGLKDTATILSKLFKEVKRPNAKIFISSRTDDEITKPFYRSLQSNKDHVVHLHLNTSDPSCMEDVSRYLSRNLQRLVEEWDLNWEVWPGRERFDKLCQRAAGLFIWAVTVVRFLEEQLRLYGDECLDGRLDAMSAEGMSDVNKLYQTILAITYTPNPTFFEDAWAHETFRWVVGFIIGLKEPLPIGDVGTLLDLRRTSTSKSINILHFTSNLRTVLVAGTGEITNDTIPSLHKSFVEFITSKKADEQFRIDLGAVNVEIALKCLRLVSRLKNNDNQSKILSASVRYAIQNWARHLPNDGTISGIAVFGDDDQVFPRIYNSAGDLRVMFVSGDYPTHIYDPRQGFPPPTPIHFNHSSSIKVGSTVSSLAVSMDGLLIASGSLGGRVHLWNGISHEPIKSPLQHSHVVNAVCFSPDSHWLVCGNADSSVRLWDCQTLGESGSPLLGHTGPVRSVWTDGHLVISGAVDETIRVWDLTSRTQIGSPINIGDSAIAVSNDGRIATRAKNSMSVWEVKTQRRIASTLIKDRSSEVFVIAFSPDNSRIASGGSDSIWLWDAQSYRRIREFTGDTKLIWSLSFSPDGQWVTSGGDDNSVCVWDCNTGRLIDLPLQGRTDSVRSVTFSPDGCQIISACHDTLRFWSKSTSKEWLQLSEQITTIHLSQQMRPIAPHLTSLDDNPSVISACYSPDHSLYAASTLDGRISLWNTASLLWESKPPIHPIHLLRLSANQLTISSADGSVWTWDMIEGKIPTHKRTLGTQLNTTNIHQFKLQSSSFADNPVVRWIPFKVDAGLWAYLDGTFIRFESVGGGSVTFIDVADIAQ